jgi:hypothetical protein
MPGGLLEELGGKGASVLLGLLIGAVSTWLVARWKRLRERRRILRGDARDTVVIAHHLVEAAGGPGGDGAAGGKRPRTLRVRSLGQSELARVVPNGHLAAVLLSRAFDVTPRRTLISRSPTSWPTGWPTGRSSTTCT